ncbi:MAG: AAA family ATPase [Tannerellaceae bacterium]|jgi:predicted ATP-dependent endonuclease of OLD family|nr:AAA family ATPase [Tannerellaceae bacterium]
MAITRIEINDFLVFKGEFVCDFHPGVNVIIGSNGTGKTTLLKCFNAALASEKDISASSSLHRQEKETRTGTFRFIPERHFSWRKTVPPSSGAPATYRVAVTATNVDSKSVTTTAKTPPPDNHPDGWYIHKPEQGGNIVVKSHIFIPEFDLLKVVQHFKREIDLLVNGHSDSGTQWFNENVLSQEQNKNGNLDRLIEDLILLYCPDAESRSLFIQLLNLANTARTAFYTEKKAMEICDKISSLLNENGYAFSGITFSQDAQSFVFSNGVSATYEASGIRRFGLLWLLLRYHLLELHNSSVLFWDEPENSLNPELIPVLAEILLELQRRGVQIFLATHSEILATYLDTLRRDSDSVMFYSLYKAGGHIRAVSSSRFDLLTPNTLTAEQVKLYEKEIGKSLGNG